VTADVTAGATTGASPLASVMAAGVFGALDLHFAELLVRRGGLADPLAVTAVALAAKAVRLEHVCCVLDDDGVRVLWRDDDGAEVPDPPAGDALVTALAAVPSLVEVVPEGADVDERGERPLVVSGTRCYLRRYALLEQLVAARLRDARDLGVPDGADAALASLGATADPEQCEAVRRALAAPVSVVAGGPGSGKTTAVALLLGVAGAVVPPLTVALSAPTGKAAARLDEAVRAAGLGDGDEVPRAVTLHRLLGLGRDGIARRRGHVDADVIVVDEASMVSLPVLAETLRRARPGSRVVLVGDPDQLASIEVGAVLSDVVAAAGDPGSSVAVSTLTTSHRFGDAAGVVDLAAAVRAGDVAGIDAAAARHATLSRHDPASGRQEVLEHVVDRAAALVDAARAGDAEAALGALSALGVLCAHRRGDGSVEWWRRAVEARLVERGILRGRDPDYVGRPLLVTRNDPLTGLANGMTGVVVAQGDEVTCAFDAGLVPLAAVAWAETAWALTIHKSQGSEYDEVVVSLPGPTSELLTRELVYTAVTRARREVTLLAPEGSLEVALARRVARSSGLVARLRATGESAAS
jgi:exodeoxyribonuclease V alpha subunit